MRTRQWGEVRFFWLLSTFSLLGKVSNECDEDIIRSGGRQESINACSKGMEGGTRNG